MACSHYLPTPQPLRKVGQSGCSHVGYEEKKPWPAYGALQTLKVASRPAVVAAMNYRISLIVFSIVQQFQHLKVSSLETDLSVTYFAQCLPLSKEKQSPFTKFTCCPKEFLKVCLCLFVCLFF